MADGAGGSQPLNDALAMIAPGTRLREGLDRILQAKHGALILVGDDPAVLSVCTGGFLLDAEYTPQRLSELAKMDGAIILAADASRIARANVHLVPKATIPTSETGTRHRTAERVARSIDVPVIAVSEAMATIAVYRNDRKHTTQSAGWLIDRSSQALSTLQRFRSRYDDALSTLTRLEMEDSVSVRDVVSVLQPGEMVRRIAEEIEGHLVELGSDGRLIHLQTEELRSGVTESLTLVLRDYADDQGIAHLRSLSADALMDLPKVVAALNLPAADDQLHAELAPHGYRLLHRLPQQLSETLIERLVERFGSLPEILSASAAELESVDGHRRRHGPPHPRRPGPPGRGQHLRAIRMTGWSGKMASHRRTAHARPGRLRTASPQLCVPVRAQPIHPKGSPESCVLQGRRQSRLPPPRGRRHREAGDQGRLR